MKSNILSLFVTVACIGLFFTESIGDTLELRNGATVEGTFLGATEDSIKFQTNIGVTIVPRSEVVSMNIGESATAAAPAQPAAQPAPQAAPEPAPVVVQAGTIMLVRMQNTVSSSNSTGTKFSAVLQSDLVAGNTVVAKAGTQVFGQVTKAVKPGRIAGRPILELALTELNINGKLVPIVTTNFSETGQSSFRKTARGAAAGAIIGEVADNDAGGGAAIGATVGALKKPDGITVPSNTVLEFRLSQPLHY